MTDTEILMAVCCTAAMAALVVALAWSIMLRQIERRRRRSDAAIAQRARELLSEQVSESFEAGRRAERIDRLLQGYDDKGAPGAQKVKEAPAFTKQLLDEYAERCGVTPRVITATEIADVERGVDIGWKAAQDAIARLQGRIAELHAKVAELSLRAAHPGCPEHLDGCPTIHAYGELMLGDFAPTNVACGHKCGRCLVERMNKRMLEYMAIPPTTPALDRLAKRFEVGQWVRYKSVGEAMVPEYMPPDGTLMNVWDTSDRAYLGVEWMRGTELKRNAYLRECFEPAVPREGETWRHTECKLHPDYEATTFKLEFDYQRCENDSGRVACGCLVPVNFGRGE